MELQWWKQQFNEHFKSCHICISLMDSMEELDDGGTALENFIIGYFRNEFHFKALFELWKDIIAPDELVEVLKQINVTKN